MTTPAPTSVPSPRRARRWLGAIVGLAAIACVGEIGLRWRNLPPPASALAQVEPSDRAEYVPDPVGFWRLAEGSTKFVGNRLGLIGRAPDSHKTERHFRIAVIGGAVASGAGVDLDDAFALRLEQAAQSEAPGARIETLILALPGFSIVQDLRLWHRLGAPFAPDVVFLYAGGWEDFQAAVAQPDLALAHELDHPPRFRIARLLRSLWRDLSGSQASGRQALPAGSEPPYGRRVAVADFGQQVRALLDGARLVGATTCVIVPALDEQHEREHPVALKYRAALRAAAQDSDASVVDADGLVTVYEDSLAAPPCPDVGTSHGLRDGVHLSAGAHALLAERLLTLVRSHPRFAALASLPARDPPQVLAVEPATVDALAAAAITVRGSGFARASGLRLWIGAESAGSIRVLDDNTLQAQVPVELVPGRHALRLGSEVGLAAVPAAAALVVAPAKFEATLARDGDDLTVELAGSAGPGCRVQVWVSTAGRANAIDTPAGPWWLQSGPHGERAGRAPFCFAAQPLRSFSAVADPAGRWQVSGRWPARDAAGAVHAVLQGVAWMPHGTGRGVATETVVRVVPR